MKYATTACGFKLRVKLSVQIARRKGNLQQEKDFCSLLDAASLSRSDTDDSHKIVSLVSHQNEIEWNRAVNIDHHAQVARNGNTVETEASGISGEAQRFEQKQMFENSARTNGTALLEFCQFYFCHNKLLKMNDSLEDEAEYRFKTQVFPFTQIHLFGNSDGIPFPNDTRQWQDRHFQKLVVVMVDFIVFHPSKSHAKQLSLFMLRSYVCGAQRAMFTD